MNVPSPQNGKQLPAKTERRALATIAGEQVAVRLDQDGFLTLVERKVRLTFGTELYVATKNPGPLDKVSPYQPGYMRLVAAMGGQLVCPPTVRDPVTSEMRPNPLVETYPDTGLVRRVTATAVCAVRNPATGEWTVSVQTSVQDAEGVLRQALMHIEREDAVQYLSPEEWAQAKAEGKAGGWIALPLGPMGALLCCNMRNQAVREAWQTFANLSLTLRQRACSKAERLAADHNPLTRRTWHYRDLTPPPKEASGPPAPPYIDVRVAALVEHKGRAEMDAFIAALASATKADGVSEFLLGAPEVDDGGDDPDADPETEPRQIAQDPTAADFSLPPRRETSPAEPAAAPATTPATTGAAPAADPLDDLRRQCRQFEGELDEAAVRDARILASLPIGADLAAIKDARFLRSYRSKLSAKLDAKGA